MLKYLNFDEILVILHNLLPHPNLAIQVGEILDSNSHLSLLNLSMMNWWL